MAEFCWKCSNKLGLDYDGFYEGEICEQCGIVKKKNLSIFSRIIKFLKRNNMKKTLLFLLLIFGVNFSFAQRVVKNELDKRTNTRYIITNLTDQPHFKELKSINKEAGSYLYLQFLTEITATTIGSYLSVSLYKLNDRSCIKANAKVVFVFKDKTELTLKNSDLPNCSNYITAMCSISKEDIQKFSTENIESVTIYTTEGPEEYFVKNILRNHSTAAAKLHLEEISKF